MNIFVYTDNPWLCALWLDDIRKNKMILEAAQMMSTAIRTNSLVEPWPHTDLVYRDTHANHPCSKWVRQSSANFQWCLEWMIALDKQRYTSHKSALLIPTFQSYLSEGWFPRADPTPFANCTPYKDLPVFDAYRQYHRDKWANETPTWVNGEQPPWI